MYHSMLIVQWGGDKEIYLNVCETEYHWHCKYNHETRRSSFSKLIPRQGNTYVIGDGDGHRNWTRRVEVSGVLGHLFEVHASLVVPRPRLVRDRPHHHRRAILVAADEFRQRLLVTAQQCRREIVRVDRWTLVDDEKSHSKTKFCTL